MKINDAGLFLIKSFEGCKLQAYQDIVGVWTIGYGHTGNDVYDGLEIDQETADNFLAQDLQRFESGVESLVQVSMNENQFSALVCFAYNVGLNNLKHSTLLKDVNEEYFDAAADQFLRWDRAGGEEVSGLLRRRKAEKALFVS